MESFEYQAYHTSPQLEQVTEQLVERELDLPLTHFLARDEGGLTKEHQREPLILGRQLLPVDDPGLAGFSIEQNTMHSGMSFFDRTGVANIYGELTTAESGSGNRVLGLGNVTWNPGPVEPYYDPAIVQANAMRTSGWPTPAVSAQIPTYETMHRTDTYQPVQPGSASTTYTLGIQDSPPDGGCPQSLAEIPSREPSPYWLRRPLPLYYDYSLPYEMVVGEGAIYPKDLPLEYQCQNDKKRTNAPEWELPEPVRETLRQVVDQCESFGECEDILFDEY